MKALPAQFPWYRTCQHVFGEWKQGYFPPDYITLVEYRTCSLCRGLQTRALHDHIVAVEQAFDELEAELVEPQSLREDADA